MATLWLVKVDDAEPIELASLGFENVVLTLVANGVDTLKFTRVGDFMEAPSIPAGSVVALIRRTGAGESLVDRCVFVGSVEGIPVECGAESITYTCYGPTYDLQLCDYSQQWTSHSDEDGDVTSYDPAVIIGEDYNGARVTAGGSIEDALDYAIGRGVSIFRGVGAIAAGPKLPKDERDNIKVWDVIVAVTRYTPDYVFWWNYDHQVDGKYVPAAMWQPASSLQAVTKALLDHDDASFTPRYDLRVPGVLVVYRWTGAVDGVTKKRRSYDSYGDVDHPRRVTLLYDLNGKNVTTQSQEVETDDYPSDWTSSAGLNWLEEQIPWLNELSGYSVLDWWSEEESGLSRYIVEGAVPDWTGKETAPETWTVEIAYEKQDADGNVTEAGVRKVQFKLTSTDASTGNYKNVTSYQAAEVAPTDLAKDLYDSWNKLHYDGSMKLVEDECSMDVLPGIQLNVTGGRDEWSSMAAVVQSASFDIDNGVTTLTTGTSGRLEADTQVALWRAVHGRRTAQSSSTRSDSGAAPGPDIAGVGGLGSENATDGAPPDSLTRIGVSARDAGDRKHKVDIDPAAVAFAVAGNAYPATIKLREIVMPYLSGGVVKASLCQALCGEAYGDDYPIGQRPNDPSSPASKGSITEAALVAGTAYDPLNPGSYDGLSLIVSLGCYYDHTAGTPKLMDYRVELKWPNAICPTVSAISPVEIDQPDY